MDEATTKITQALIKRKLPRLRLFMMISPLLVMLWSLFDYFLEPLLFVSFFAARLSYSMIVLAIYLWTPKSILSKRADEISLFIYTYLTIAILFMVLQADNFFPYLSGFCLVFLGSSALLILNYRYYMMPIWISAILCYAFQDMYLSNPNFDSFTFFFVSLTIASLCTLNSHFAYKSIHREESLKLEISEKNAHLKESNDRKQNLVRILCHDLNNTIHLISLCAQAGIATDSPQNVKQNKLWKKVLQATTTQKDIVNHVREMEAVVSGKKAVTLRPINLEKSIEQALFLNKDAIQKKGLHISFKQKEISSVYFMADEVSFSNHVFNNLISNAIKFSYEGGCIEVKACHFERDKVKITISDHGIGMPKNIRENLFRSDYQTSRPGTQGEKGTGFGMPLVKSYMDHYNAEILVASITHEESADQHGTEFILILHGTSGKV